MNRYKITFKVAPHYMYVSESFIDEVSDNWKKLTKVIKIDEWTLVTEEEVIKIDEVIINE